MRALPKKRSAVLLFLLFVATPFAFARPARAEVKAWQGTVTIPTYPWQDDVNPKFWAIEGGPKLSTTVKGSIIYPYTMQDHLSRAKVDRTYKALFLENEYLKVMCLPELGGRLHSVLDKTQGEEMFHLNDVIKPGMIAMRGAWISGGVEWNTGPHGHTVAIVSPVDAVIGRHPDGSAFLEISNLEKIFRTRWTVRVTLHPGKAYLDEQIRIVNPTDGMHPYYFWNCTAFPNRPGTRFIYPMSLGTDHDGRKFFSWPIHQGKDLSWLKNYETSTSIFAVGCEHDFFGAYDVEADRGIVQVADHHELGGKKAWTWGQWDFGLVSQQSLTDGDGPYIEVQTGPLPTQSDYGMLAPRQQVSWREWWFPAHGLGDGFEFATKDLAVQTIRTGGKLELRLLATGEFPGAVCTLSQKNRKLLEKRIDLSPKDPQTVLFETLSAASQSPVHVSVKTADGSILAAFITPLPIPQTPSPKLSMLMEKPDEELTLEEKYLKGRKYDRATDRLKARAYYEKTLAEDAGHLLALRALAVLDLEAGLVQTAIGRLTKALGRDSDDGLCWYFLGVCHLRLHGEPPEHEREALRCGYRAARCFGTASLGYDLAGRAQMRLKEPAKAVKAFAKAVRANLEDDRAKNHLLLARHAAGMREAAAAEARRRIAGRPTDLVPRAVLALASKDAMQRFAAEARAFVGEDDFEMLETSLVFAELGLASEAAKVLAAGCVEAVPPDQQSPLPHYYLAYYASLQGQQQQADAHLRRAAAIYRDFVFPSRPQAVEVLQYAVEQNPGDAHAHFHLGNLLGGLGRLEQAAVHWRKAAELKPALSVALRNLGVYAASRGELAKAEAYLRRAVAARSSDQTLYRDLAELLIARGRRGEAIRLLATMPHEKLRRADVIIMLARAYLDEQRFTETIDLLESTPYFVNWEGQSVTWEMFNRAHRKRGERRMAAKDFQAALQDFQAALTYPENLGVGRSNSPEESPAQYFRGKALEALGRGGEARAAWKAGAALGEGSQQQNKYRRLCTEMPKTTP